MKKIIFAITALVYFASCSSNGGSESEAEGQDSAVIEESGVSGSYSIDLSSSYATWEGAHLVGSTHNGQVKLNEGSFTMENGLITKGELIFNLNTISAIDMTGNTEDSTKLINHLKNKDFFHVDSFPFASFEVTGSEMEEENMVITGNLTIKGISNVVSFNSSVNADATSFTANGEIEVNRTVWGLKFGSKSFFADLAADRIVKDNIKLGFNITANPK